MMNMNSPVISASVSTFGTTLPFGLSKEDVEVLRLQQQILTARAELMKFEEDRLQIDTKRCRNQNQYAELTQKAGRLQLRKQLVEDAILLLLLSEKK